MIIGIDQWFHVRELRAGGVKSVHEGEASVKRATLGLSPLIIASWIPPEARPADPIHGMSV